MQQHQRSGSYSARSAVAKSDRVILRLLAHREGYFIDNRNIPKCKSEHKNQILKDCHR